MKMLDSNSINYKRMTSPTYVCLWPMYHRLSSFPFLHQRLSSFAHYYPRTFVHIVYLCMLYSLPLTALPVCPELSAAMYLKDAKWDCYAVLARLSGPNHQPMPPIHMESNYHTISVEP
eukprot:c1618_g1_i1 orf=427-780(+)